MSRIPQPATPRRRSLLSVGWGLIGVSRVADVAMLDAIRHQPTLPEAEDVIPSWVMGVYSRSDHRARDFSQRRQIPYAFDALEKMWDRPEIQCVYISAQPRYQAELALTAIDAGKHVLCETPLALTPQEARNVLARARQKDVLLAVDYALRCHPALTRCAELIRDYTIGDVLGVRLSNCDPLPFAHQTWRMRTDGGGILLDRTLHDVDLLRWLLADDVEQVAALNGGAFLTEGPNRVVEEEILGVARMKRGVAAQIHDSWAALHQHSVLEIYGTGGTLIAYRWWGEWRNSELILVRNDEVTELPIAKTSPYEGIVAAFNAAVRKRDWLLNRRSVLATGEDAARNLEIIERIREEIR
jgi:1,5-anhydro-D-fructose reductase (1,5-anhydro-D-mannitol-forming)